MSELNGFFSLRTPQDILEKLENDYARLRAASPTSREAQYAAFDFFVCAEHLADWVKNTNGGTLTSHRSYPEGALVSHIANGAKHFSVDISKHSEAKNTRVAGPAYWPGQFQWNAFQTFGFLVIELENGTTTSVLSLAQLVLSHWQNTLKPE